MNDIIKKCLVNCEEREMEELGEKVVLSAAYFEAGVAAILITESKKLQLLIRKCKEEKR